MINTWHSYFFGCWQVKFTALPWANVCKIISSTFRGSRQGALFSNVWKFSILRHFKITFLQVFDCTSDFPYGTKTTSTKSLISSQSGPTLSITSENDQTYTETASIASVDAIADNWQKKNKIWKWNCMKDYEEENHADPQNPPRPNRQNIIIVQEPLILTYSRGPM